MKKIYTLFAALSLAFTMNSQTTLTNAVDFTVTDLNGNTHNLFSLLSAGKTVCIDFFFTTCPPCQQTVPFFKETYTNYGCNTADIFFISVDQGNTDAECVAYENTYLGGPAGFPVASGDDGGGNAVCSAYGITAYPTYILIAPNQAIIEQDMWPISSAASFTTFMSAHSYNQTPCASGITEAADLNNTKLYPNPASDVLNVTSDFAIISYSIFDNSGRLGAESTLAQPAMQTTVNVAEFATGLYFVESRTEQGVSRSKFNKQ